MSERSNPQPSEHGSRPSGGRGRLLRRLVLVAVVVLVAGLLYWQFGRYLNLEELAAREARLRAAAAGHPVLVLGVAFLVYVAVTAFSIPAAVAITMALGWLCKLMFGELPGMLLAVTVVSFASTTGATLAFLMSRYLFRDVVQRRFGARLARFNERLAREGAFYLFTLRLVPVVPFFVINAVMGLTPMRIWTYWWVSQLGMLPGTVVYVYAGSQLPTLHAVAEEGPGGVLDWQIVLAFVLIGVFPIAVKKGMEWFGRRPEGDATNDVPARSSEQT